MKKSISKRSVRLAGLLFFASSAVLLTGAGKLSGDLRSRSRTLEENRQSVIRSLHTVLDGTLSEQNEKEASLIRLAKEKPELMLSLLCGELTPLRRK